MSEMKPNQVTRQVKVGKVALGGGAPCVVQSMLNLPLEDVEGNLAQIERLAEAGCELIRIAIPHKRDLDYFETICARSVLPVIADIHFSAEIAIEAARRGAAKLRINPGNIGSAERVKAVVDKEFLFALE